MSSRQRETIPRTLILMLSDLTPLTMCHPRLKLSANVLIFGFEDTVIEIIIKAEVPTCVTSREHIVLFRIGCLRESIWAPTCPFVMSTRKNNLRTCTKGSFTMSQWNDVIQHGYDTAMPSENISVRSHSQPQRSLQTLPMAQEREASRSGANYSSSSPTRRPKSMPSAASAPRPAESDRNGIWIILICGKWTCRTLSIPMVGCTCEKQFSARIFSLLSSGRRPYAKNNHPVTTDQELWKASASARNLMLITWTEPPSQTPCGSSLLKMQ